MVDYGRATRINGKLKSFEPFKELLKNKRFSLYLLKMPYLTTLNSILPTKIVELCGVQHIKSYVFDDDVLISGLLFFN